MREHGGQGMNGETEHKLTVRIERDETSTLVKAECNCETWRAMKNLSGTDNHPVVIQEEAREMMYQHRAHIWGADR